MNEEEKIYAGDSIFWVEVDKIKPNPYQPRREFEEKKLQELADSIKQYGVLQPLVVTRQEKEKEDGGLITEYELIAGERRLRASKIAGVQQVPVVIRTGEQSNTDKLELAIIENVQREDLNAVDRARAFHQLSAEFGLTHSQIALKVGKSREYVSNTIRVLALPEEMLTALSHKAISEGHARTLLMLVGKLDEQQTLFKEILYKKLSVREAENISKKIAIERIRKPEKIIDPVIMEIENQLSEKLGTRVQIENKGKAKRVVIDFFSTEDLENLLGQIQERKDKLVMPQYREAAAESPETGNSSVAPFTENNNILGADDEQVVTEEEGGDDLYSISNFTV